MGGLGFRFSGEDRVRRSACEGRRLILFKLGTNKAVKAISWPSLGPFSVRKSFKRSKLFPPRSAIHPVSLTVAPVRGKLRQTTKYPAVFLACSQNGCLMLKKRLAGWWYDDSARD